MGDAGIPHDKHPEPVPGVLVFHDIQDMGDVIDGVLEAASHIDGEQGRHAVPGRQAQLYGDVGGVVVARAWSGDVVPQLSDAGIHAFDFGLEVRVLQVQGVGLDDDDLTELTGPSESVNQQGFGLLGLGSAAQAQLSGGSPIQDVHQLWARTHLAIDSKAARDQGDNQPDSKDEARPTGAGPGQPLSQDNSCLPTELAGPSLDDDREGSTSSSHIL